MTPSIGFCATPLTVWHLEPASLEDGGRDVDDVVPLVAGLAARLDALAGQCTIMPSRVPPKWATCLVHWYGVYMPAPSRRRSGVRRRPAELVEALVQLEVSY